MFYLSYVEYKVIIVKELCVVAKGKKVYTLSEISSTLGLKETVLQFWCESGEILCVKDVTQKDWKFAIREENLDRLF